MSRKDPQGIADIIASLKHSEDLGRHFEVAKIWREWPRVVGPKLMPYGRPLGIRDTTLFVEIESAVWMHRFSYRKWELLGRINDILRGHTIDEIFFVLTNTEGETVPQDDV